MDLLRRRRVLDQFQHFVAENDRAFGGTQILAYLESRLVDLRRHALIFEQVHHDVVGAVQQAGATRINDLLERRRIA